jgi:SAM-dependent methyltransferase
VQAIRERFSRKRTMFRDYSGARQTFRSLPTRIGEIMTAAPPPLFDRRLIRRRLAHASNSGGADFLLVHAVHDLLERLSIIKRSFSFILDSGTPSPFLAKCLAERDAGSSVLRLAPVVAAHASAAPILAVVGDEETPPLAGQRFDLAVSALALQYVNDLPGALVQLRRVLKPDGLFLGCLLGGRTLEELRKALALAETEISGGISPRVAPFADVRDMGGLLQRAGFALPVVDSEPLVARYDSLLALISDLRAMGATNPLAARIRKPTARRLFLRAAEIYTERFADPDGKVRATFELIFVSGWAPHESQQKPLAPGSAKMRLEDALRPK